MSRFEEVGRSAFQKNIGESDKGPVPVPPPPEGKDAFEDHADRHKELRFLLVDLGVVRLQAIAVERLHMFYPELKEKVSTWNDFVEMHKDMVVDRKMRTMTYKAQFKIITREMIIRVEKLLLAFVGLECVPKLVGSQKPLKTNRRSGNVAKLLNRCKHTYLLDTLRSTGLRIHGECPCDRDLKDKKHMGIIAHMLKVTAEECGHNGFLALTASHPLCIALLMEQEKQLNLAEGKRTADEAAEQKKQIDENPKPSDFQSFCMLQLAQGVTDMALVMAEWEKKEKRTGTVISISDNDTARSPLTQDSVSSFLV